MNTPKRVNLIENIKNILLVVLFLFTILLLYLFWGNASLRSANADYQKGQAIDVAAILEPDRLEVCFGGDVYTVVEKQYRVFMDCFKTFAGSRNLSVEEISKAVYEETIQQPSIKAVYEYFIPFTAICEIHEIDRISGADTINSVSELAYAERYDDRLFVADRRADKYYVIVGSASRGFAALRDEIESLKNSGFSYFPLGTYVGGENRALCPESFESSLSDIPYSLEDFSKQPENGASIIIKSFFSDNFDFVRRIEEENGTTIYMYGYGRIVVIARGDGTLEFKMEDEERALSQLKYIEAFERANAFIAAHGAFEAVRGMSFTPYLKEVMVDPAGKKGFRFVFGVKINGSKVYYQSEAPMIIDVTGGRVSYFKRNILNVSPNDFMNADDMYRKTHPALNALAGNFEYIYGILSDNQIVKTADLSFEDVADLVGRFDSGYVRIDENKKALNAAWIIIIGGIEFYFGLDDGEPLGYSVK
jgi:hypothetical protein